MSETTQNKVFKVKKTIPGVVLFSVFSINNPTYKRTVTLTNRNPSQFLPLDWALSIFIDDGNYRLYKSGAFTFEDNDALVRAAFEAGVYFDEKLDFVPAKENNEEIILKILNSGVRKDIEEAIKEYGKVTVTQVAVAHVDELRTGVVNMLEGMLKVQLIVDGADTESK